MKEKKKDQKEKTPVKPDPVAKTSDDKNPGPEGPPIK